jgi:hypothetical protein
VKAVDDQRIQYETDQGNGFQVTVEKEKDDSRYRAPEKIK